MTRGLGPATALRLRSRRSWCNCRIARRGEIASSSVGKNVVRTTATSGTCGAITSRGVLTKLCWASVWFHLSCLSSVVVSTGSTLRFGARIVTRLSSLFFMEEDFKIHLVGQQTSTCVRYMHLWRGSETKVSSRAAPCEEGGPLGIFPSVPAFSKDARGMPKDWNRSDTVPKTDPTRALYWGRRAKN